MNTKDAYLSIKRLLVSAAFVLVVSTTQGWELKVFGGNSPALDFHGFASQGFIWNTGHNDYLGGNSSDGTFDFREYGVNASMAYGKWRVGAQVFAQKLGQYGNDKVTLDWANLDYQATQWFGLRVGRVKTPRGLYNEALDLDFTRPFVLLPQSVYDARLRDFNSSFDGGMAYGNIELKKAGSLDYRLYGGHIGLSTSSGASDYFNNDVPLANASFSMDATFGGSLFWNTPVQGLRIGYSYQGFQNFRAARIMQTEPTLSLANRGTDLYSRHLLSAEYTLGKWVFAAEAGMDTAHYVVTFPNGTPSRPGRPSRPTANLLQDFKSQYAYVSVARRLTDRLELGAYYSYSDDKLKSTASYNYPQGDFAVSARYDFTENLLGKIELHYLDGSGKLFDTASHRQPAGKRDSSSFMIAAKFTFSF